MKKILPLLPLVIAFAFPPVESATKAIDVRTMNRTNLEIIQRKGFMFIGSIEGNLRVVTNLWLIQLGVAGVVTFLLARQSRDAGSG